MLEIYKKLVPLFSHKSIPKPHAFVITSLKSNVELTEIISEVSRLIPQLTDFINQFHGVVSEFGVNVITDSAGNMSIDVPRNMPDNVANNISTRLGIIDRLITDHGTNINSLFQKGLVIEKRLEANDSNYVSQLTNQINQFKTLNSSYKH